MRAPLTALDSALYLRDGDGLLPFLNLRGHVNETQRELVPAVVLGLGINGLGTVRSLARRGIPVIAITSGTREPSEHTRYAERVILPSMQDPASLVACLLRVAERFDGKSVVFPSGDETLAAISDNRDALSARYHLPCARRDVIRTILDKGHFYRFAQSHGIPIAPTYFPATVSEGEDLARSVRLPCVIKPAIATAEWRRRGLKVIPVSAPDEFKAMVRLAFEVTDDVIVQEVTPGPDSALHFSLTYLDSGSTPLAMFTGRKLRQYVPRFGISSMAESRWVPEVAQITERILGLLGYTGYASVEMKLHPDTGEYLTTEVTGRTWYPHALSEYCGVNLPYIAYCDLTGRRATPAPQTFPDGVKWIDEVGDFKSALSYWREGELSLGEWARSYRGRRRWALAARDDPKPFLMLCGRLAVRAILAPALAVARPVRRLFRSLRAREISRKSPG